MVKYVCDFNSKTIYKRFTSSEKIKSFMQSCESLGSWCQSKIYIKNKFNFTIHKFNLLKENNLEEIKDDVKKISKIFVSSLKWF